MNPIDKVNFDMGIFANMIVDSNREARQLEQDKKRYGETKLVKEIDNEV